MSTEKDLTIDVLKTVWLAKWSILLFTLVVTVIAWAGINLLIQKQYVSKSTFLISSSKYAQEKKTDFLTVDDYKRLLLTNEMLQEVIDRLKTQHPAYGGMYPEHLKGMVAIDYLPQGLSLSTSRAVLVIVSVRGTDRSFIKDVANILPNLLIERSKSIRESENEAIAKEAQSRYDTNFNALLDAEEQLQKLMAANHLETAEGEILVLRTNLQQHEVMLIKTEIDLINLKSMPNPPAAMSKTLKRSSTKYELVRSSILRLKNGIKVLEDSVYKMRLKEKQLARKIKLLTNNNEALAARLEKIALSESEKTSDVKIIGKATESKVPVSPNTFMLTLFAVASSLVLGLVVACTREQIKAFTP